LQTAQRDLGCTAQTDDSRKVLSPCSPLALVIASALTINLFSAALAGVLVPITLKRMGFDPALAGGVILTTVTDVMGFLSFLGLATLVLLR